VKQTGLEPGHLRVSGSEVKNAWNYIPPLNEYLLGEVLSQVQAQIYWVADDLGHSYLALKEHTAYDKHLVYLILISVTALLTRIGTAESRMVQRLQVSSVLAASCSRRGGREFSIMSRTKVSHRCCES
jgi:hypothetical protein